MCTKSEYVPLEVGCEYVRRNNGHLTDSDFGPAGDLQIQIGKHNLHKLGRPSITLSPLPLGRGCEVLRKSDIDDGEKRATGSWGLEAAAAVRSRARHEARFCDDPESWQWLVAGRVR